MLTFRQKLNFCIINMPENYEYERLLLGIKESITNNHNLRITEKMEICIERSFDYIIKNLLGKDEIRIDDLVAESYRNSRQLKLEFGIIEKTTEKKKGRPKKKVEDPEVKTILEEPPGKPYVQPMNHDNVFSLEKYKNRKAYIEEWGPAPSDFSNMI